jgi:capsular polysaccharide biosynthesis protein
MGENMDFNISFNLLNPNLSLFLIPLLAILPAVGVDNVGVTSPSLNSRFLLIVAESSSDVTSSSSSCNSFPLS